MTTAQIVEQGWTEVLTMDETIKTIANIACICFAVYGIIVFSRWRSVVEKIDIVFDELRQEIKDGADHEAD